ncbi:hypothetical protein CapIbe_015755 [Capra ibex]
MNCRARRHCPERGKGKSATGKQPSPLAKGSAPWQPTPAEGEVHEVQKPRLSNGSVLENAISREGPDQLSRAPVQGSHTATLTGTSPCSSNAIYQLHDLGQVIQHGYNSFLHQKAVV